jgi:NhaA family Na+:H+ antiporter
MADDLTPHTGDPTWIASDRPIARLIARPLREFLHVEAAGGILLLVAAVVALLWSNSPWQASYNDLWHTDATLRVGTFSVTEDLRHWINDGLMAVFFFVVGLEIKRELVEGHLSSLRGAALPALAALGGMVVPAVLYAIINLGGDGSSGWGVPMATDIAFAVGVLAVLGDRITNSARVLLLALAIVDDIGAIAVIAVFYSEHLHLGWLLAALVGMALVVSLRRVRVWYLPVYMVLGVAVWWCTFQSGVHATLAGVALGLAAPARPLLNQPQAEQIAGQLSEDAQVTTEDVHRVSFALRESVSVAERVGTVLHPWSSYVIVPVFALANAGVAVSWDGLSDAARSPVTLGVILGLAVGKPLGIVASVALATRTGIGRLPEDLGWRDVVGLGALAGIGFTVSLFITGLAFDEATLRDQAELGVFAASSLAAVAGTILLGSRRPAGGEGDPTDAADTAGTGDPGDTADTDDTSDPADPGDTAGTGDPGDTAGRGGAGGAGGTAGTGEAAGADG